MTSTRISNNNREAISGQSTVNSLTEYIKTTAGAVNIIGSQTVPAAGVTQAAAVQIVDASGNQITSFGLLPVTSGGLTTYSASVGATATSVKASQGQLYGWYIDNPNNATTYVQFFNLGTGSVVLGTTPPFFSIGVPANGASNIAWPIGLAFSTAITYACTTTRTGLTGPGSTVDINFFYA